MTEENLIRKIIDIGVMLDNDKLDYEGAVADAKTVIEEIKQQNQVIDVNKQHLYNRNEIRHIAVNYAIHCLKGYKGTFTEWFDRIVENWREIANRE